MSGASVALRRLSVRDDGKLDSRASQPAAWPRKHDGHRRSCGCDVVAEERSKRKADTVPTDWSRSWKNVGSEEQTTTLRVSGCLALVPFCWYPSLIFNN